jgi:hypothetical protein
MVKELTGCDTRRRPTILLRASHRWCEADAVYICRHYDFTMSDHHFDGHFPEEAEQNEIGGPVLVALFVLATVVLLIWAAS